MEQRACLGFVRGGEKVSFYKMKRAGTDMIEELSNEECIETLKVHFSVRNHVQKESVQIETVRRVSDSSFYRVRFLDREYVMEMDDKTLFELNRLLRRYRLIG